MKIVFFGTSSVALPALEALSKTHEVLAVVTQPDSKVGRKQELTESPVSILANKIKLKVLKPEKVKDNREFYQQLQSLVAPSPNPSPAGRGIEDAADVFVVVSYGNLVPKEILSMPKFGCLNIHPSLLPKYRGPTPFVTALLNGETKTGTTIMLMDEKLDEGPIIAQEEVLIDADDNAITLGDKLARVSANLLLKVLQGSVPFPKTEQEHSQATYTKILEKADGKIGWSKTSQEIYNQFRAFYAWPGVWTTWNEKMLKITELQINSLQKTTESSETGKVYDQGVVVCGNGTSIKIKTLQLEGKKEMPIEAFLNGNKSFVGSKLG